MQYKFRWLYAGSVMAMVLLVGFIIDLSSRWQDLQIAWQEERLLKNKVLKLPKIRIAPAVLSTDERVYLAPQIMTLAAKQGMNVSKLFQLAKGDLHLVAEASYESVMKFIPQLEARYGLVAFTFRTIANDKIELLADIASTQTSVIPGVLPMPSPTYNPFCWQVNDEPVSAQEIKQKIKQTKLSDLQLIASLHHRNRARAWLSLPDQALAEIEVGDVVGEEQARVIAVARQSITLETKDNHQVVMRMQ